MHLRLYAGRYQAVESLVQIKSLTCWMSMSRFHSGNSHFRLWHLWKPCLRGWTSCSTNMCLWFIFIQENTIISIVNWLSKLASFSQRVGSTWLRNHWKRSLGGGFSPPVIGETLSHGHPKESFYLPGVPFFSATVGVVLVVEIGGRYIMMHGHNLSQKLRCCISNVASKWYCDWNHWCFISVSRKA